MHDGEAALGASISHRSGCARLHQHPHRLHVARADGYHECGVALPVLPLHLKLVGVDERALQGLLIEGCQVIVQRLLLPEGKARQGEHSERDRHRAHCRRSRR